MRRASRLALFFFILILASLPVVMPSPQASDGEIVGGPPISPLEYEVWLAALAPMGGEASSERLVLDPRAGLMHQYRDLICEALGDLVLSLDGCVIYPETDVYHVTQAEWRRMREAVRDFAARNSRVGVIENRFEGAPGLRIATMPEIEAMEDPEADKWEEFKRLFPEAWRFCRVSRVGFSEDGLVAVFYRTSGDGVLSRIGGLYVYKLADGAWEEIGHYGVWIT